MQRSMEVRRRGGAGAVAAAEIAAAEGLLARRPAATPAQEPASQQLHEMEGGFGASEVSLFISCLSKRMLIIKQWLKERGL